MKTLRAEVDLSGGKLLIDGVLQSDRRDEYIYHEALVHPALSHSRPGPKKVLILGGAEGCTAREVLKWGDDVKSVTQVDWDGELCDMFYDMPEWNTGAYYNTKMKLVIGDAWEFCRVRDAGSYDVILVDLLDPDAGSLLAFLELLGLCQRLLRAGGTLAANCGGVWPWDAGCLPAILSALPAAIPYKVFVPSFEWEWSFILLAGAGTQPAFPSSVRSQTKMFDLETAWPLMKTWTRDWAAALAKK